MQDIDVTMSLKTDMFKRIDRALLLIFSPAVHTVKRSDTLKIGSAAVCSDDTDLHLFTSYTKPR